MITYLSGPGHISPHVIINSLPDEVLLIIFAFCRVVTLKCQDELFLEYPWPGPWPLIWHELTEVCQRWRYIMFSSPLRLDLRIYCTNHNSVKLLDVWPPFPIEVYPRRYDDNIIAALEHHNRVRQIDIGLPRSQPELERFTTIMQEPFPTLTSLSIWSESEPQAQAEGPPADGSLVGQLPDTFLAGSAPRLRSLTLTGVPFPTLPQLLSSLSFNDLSTLWLQDIPNLGYISPDAMVTGLSALTRLTTLCLNFQEFHLDRITRHSPPFTRLILPALTSFYFHGVNEYLEALLAQIDAPQLETFSITFFPEPILDIRELIYHSQTLWSFIRANVTITDHDAKINLVY
jgi:hypothetical protein